MDVVLMGVTQELAGMPWPAGTQLLAVDRSNVMIEQVLPRHPTVELGSHCGNWLSLPKLGGSAGCIIGLDQGREIRLEITAGQSVGTAVDMLSDPPHGAGIGLDGILAFALTLQYANMALVQ